MGFLGLEILDDSRLVCGCDIGAGVVEGQRADGSVVACRMISKLDVNPLQAVSSPLVEPVSMRRPSGVHKVATSGGEKDRQQFGENDKLRPHHATSIFICGRVDEFGTE